MTPRRHLDDRTADALLSGRQVDGEPELSELIGRLRSLADGPAPAPSTALAALLENGQDAATVVLPVIPVRRATPWRRRAFAFPLQLSLAGAGCLALLLGAAAANQLPASAQTAVADVVEAITPLHVPRPADRPGPAVVPSPTPTPTPGAVAGEQNPSPGSSQDEQVRGGDNQPSGPSHAPGTHEPSGEQGKPGGDRPEASPSPEPRRPAETSGDGQGSGDRRRSGQGSGKMTPTPAAPSESSAPDGGSGSGSGSGHSADPPAPSTHD